MTTSKSSLPSRHRMCATAAVRSGSRPRCPCRRIRALNTRGIPSAGPPPAEPRRNPGFGLRHLLGHGHMRSVNANDSERVRRASSIHFPANRGGIGLAPWIYCSGNVYLVVLVPGQLMPMVRASCCLLEFLKPGAWRKEEGIKKQRTWWWVMT
jgi:hypothetical protein